MAELRVLRFRHQLPESVTRDMHQRPVVATLEVDVRLLAQFLVHQCLQVVGRPGGWHRTQGGRE